MNSILNFFKNVFWASPECRSELADTHIFYFIIIMVIYVSSEIFFKRHKLNQKYYEIIYTSDCKIVLYAPDGNSYLIAQLRLNSQKELIFKKIYEKQGIFDRKSLAQSIKKEITYDFNDYLGKINFTGEIRKLFFAVKGKSHIQFKSKIIRSEALKGGINFRQLNKELRALQRL